MIMYRVTLQYSNCKGPNVNENSNLMNIRSLERVFTIATGRPPIDVNNVVFGFGLILFIMPSGLSGISFNRNYHQIITLLDNTSIKQHYKDNNCMSASITMLSHRIL